MKKKFQGNGQNPNTLPNPITNGQCLFLKWRKSGRWLWRKLIFQTLLIFMKFSQKLTMDKNYIGFGIWSVCKFLLKQKLRIFLGVPF